MKRMTDRNISRRLNGFFPHVKHLDHDRGSRTHLTAQQNNRYIPCAVRCAFNSTYPIIPTGNGFSDWHFLCSYTTDKKC